MNKKQAWILFSIFIVGFLAVKIATIGPSINDENVYFYMVQQMTEGELPYTDFFYAHPPLQLIIYSLFWKLFGSVAYLSFISIALASLYLFRLVQERFGGEVGLISIMLFLFSFDMLRFSSFNMGINLAVMFSVIGLYYLFEQKYYASGIIFGLAGLIRFYAVVPFVLFAIILFLKNRKQFLKFMYGFSGVFLLVNITMLLVFQGNYYDSVFQYHLDKPGQDGDKFALFKRSIELNPLMYALALASLFFYNKKIGIVYFAALAYGLFLLIFPSIFNFYFMLLFPLLIIMVSQSVSTLFNMKRGQNVVVMMGMILMVLISGWNIMQYVQYDLNDFSKSDEISHFIVENSDEGALLFGDDSITPLLAIKSGRKIVSGYADSNNLRWRSGISETTGTITQLKNNLKFFIVYKIKFGNVEGVYGPAFLEEFQEFYTTECEPAQIFSEPAQEYTKIYEVWDCS